jgi:hypothetical protein
VAFPKTRRFVIAGDVIHFVVGAIEFVAENSFDILQIALFRECLSDCVDLATCRIDCILCDLENYLASANNKRI